MHKFLVLVRFKLTSVGSKVDDDDHYTKPAELESICTLFLILQNYTFVLMYVGNGVAAF
jgi:hypothetical protein